MNIVGAFIEGLPWCQCYLLSTLQLHHNGALQYVNNRMRIVSVNGARPAGRMLYRDHQNFPAGILRKIFRYERRDLRLLSHRRAGQEAQQNQRNEFSRHSHLFRSSPGTSSYATAIRAVSYETTIDQLFKRMRSSSSALTQQAVNTPRGPVPNERRRRRPPHGRRTGTTGEWPPATRGSPPARAEDGPGRGPRRIC